MLLSQGLKHLSLVSGCAYSQTLVKQGLDYFSCKKKYEFRIIIGRYDVSVAKKIDQSESVNKPVTKRGLTNIDIDSRIWAPPDKKASIVAELKMKYYHIIISNC